MAPLYLYEVLLMTDVINENATVIQLLGRQNRPEIESAPNRK